MIRTRTRVRNRPLNFTEYDYEYENRPAFGGTEYDQFLERKLAKAMKDWLKKYLIKPERLRGERIHQIVGDRLFDTDIWHISCRSISGGLALGLFIAFTPTIPFQMLLSAVCAIWLRVNLPIAIGACWVTNPFTVVWVYFMEYRLGQAIMGKLPGVFALSDLENIGALQRLFSQATYVWTGGVIMGAAAALTGYIAVQIAWRLFSSPRTSDVHAIKIQPGSASRQSPCMAVTTGEPLADYPGGCLRRSQDNGKKAC